VSQGVETFTESHYKFKYEFIFIALGAPAVGT